ncbi:type VII secretion protein EssA [Listeria rocourtiae]|uniref:Type VII secretion protein EssA n=2 Tax=Listeria rocourtiae TaxID=647910 RepID=A0A4R6ZPZ7_9LIST|nr:type VII secretion protein EssA [Listeria rocourtiae]
MMMCKKRMISVLVTVLVGTIVFIPVSVLAAGDEESYLGDNGKMEMQLERATKTDEEKDAEMDTEQTELEKLGITLFTPEAEKNAAEIKAQEKKEMDDTKAALFTGESQKDNSVQLMKAALFTEQDATAKSKDANTLGQEETEKSSKTIWWVLSGIVLAVGAMLYMVVRKVWE